jgi:hypothetical protein
MNEIVPNLFIGLGGIGSRIVDRIAGRAVRLPDWESRLRPLTSFATIDSNNLDQHHLTHIPDANRLSIGGFDKVRVIEHLRRLEDPRVLKWLGDDQPLFRALKRGAGQIRIESRLGFFYRSREIRQRLRELVVESLHPGISWRQSRPPKYNVHLFCTLAGGTGSGSFLSAAYLVDDVLRTQGLQPRVTANLLLSTLLLDRVAPELQPFLHANTYAALKELEHLTKLDYRQVKDEGRLFEEFAYSQSGKSQVTTRPFFVSFLFDRPASAALIDAEAAVADAAFLQIFTPILDILAGELDNYEKALEELTRLPGDLENPGLGYTRHFGCFGAAALVLPGHDLLEYSVLRFAAQAIRSQISFGGDSSDPIDGRARALQLVSLDYDDVRFLTMSDEEQERAIHETFLKSVAEMARQDDRPGLADGFWRQISELVDGRASGSRESLVQQIDRRLTEAWHGLLDRISIRDRAFLFRREEVNQYIEHVSRFFEDTRVARQIIDQGVHDLEAAMEMIFADLELDPFTERFLVGRLLERCEKVWLPVAQQQLEAAKIKDADNPKVREHLQRHTFESLLEAASKRNLLFRSERDFLAAREKAQEILQDVILATRRSLAAEVRLRQLRALHNDLKRRLRQYARLAKRMDFLARSLEDEAERLRRGDTAAAPPLALRVEVFETLDEPRQRLWDRVYRALFLESGHRLFDPHLLAATIVPELQTGKLIDQAAADLRRALHELGQKLLAPAIFGSGEEPGLDLARGLDLEARLMLALLKQPGEDVTEAEIDEYHRRKLDLLARRAGILARIEPAERRRFDDNVKVNRTRQLLIGLGETSSTKASEAFIDRIQAALSDSPRRVKVEVGEDPHLLVVHASEFPVPLYHFEAVTRELERSYRLLKAQPQRSYPFHIDSRWEDSLPNLNPAPEPE